MTEGKRTLVGMSPELLTSSPQQVPGAVGGRPLIPMRRQEFAAMLEQFVLDGTWEVGQRIPSERELGQRHGVSRPVVREVLASLAERGFLDIQPGKGSFIRAVSVDHLADSLTHAARRAGITARDLVIARVAIECAAADLAAQNPQRSLVTLKKSLHDHETAVGVHKLAQTDLEYHEAVVAEAGNPVLVLMFGSIRAQVFALMLRSHSDPEVRRIGEPLHAQIAEAIEKGDATAARDLMRQHLELALDLYGVDLDRPISDVVESMGISVASPLSG